MNQHRYDSFNKNCHLKFKTALSQAIRKYGWNNFSMEILAERNTENEICELEKYFIKKYNTFKGEGYNLSEGGEYGYTNRHYDSKVQKDVLMQIVEDLKSGKTQNQIAKKYNLSPSYISNINNGTRLKLENETYPLHKSRELYIHSICSNIIEDLIKTSISIRKLAKKYNITPEIIRKINEGTYAYVIENYDLTYPLRKNK